MLDAPFLWVQFLVLPYGVGKLLNPMTSSHKNHRADYAVVGSGIAGLRAAIELSAAGSVLVLAKSNLSDSATAWAQGGIAVALSDEDEIGLHEQDTINAGDGLCRPEAVALVFFLRLRRTTQSTVFPSKSPVTAP